MSYNARQTQAKGYHLLRLVLIAAWLLTIGTTVSRADDNASTEEEVVINFADHSELLSQLNQWVTDWKDSGKDHIETKLHNYDVVLDHCLSDNNKLKIKGEQLYQGYVQGTIPGQVTAIQFNKSNTKKGTVKIVLNEGKTDEQTISQAISGQGNMTIAIPEDKQVKDASIKIVPDFQLDITSLTLVRLATGGPDVNKLWLQFKKNGQDITTDSEPVSIPAGQIITLDAQPDIEGFDPVSSPNNNYLVIYSVDGVEPTFSGAKDNSGNWKNGQEIKDANGNVTGHGYVYRRGIVLDGAAGADINVWVKIYKVSTSSTEGTLVKEVKEVKKAFALTSSNRPKYNTEHKDIVFLPKTMRATYDQNWHEGMVIVDKTESVTAESANGWTGNWVISKYSSNTFYNLQELLNAVNVKPRLNKAKMTSSENGLRMASAMQYTPDGIACEKEATAYYWYVPERKNLILQAVPSTTKLSMVTGEDPTKVKEQVVELTAYYLDADGYKVNVNLNMLKSSPNDTQPSITIKVDDEDIANLEQELVIDADGMKGTFKVKPVSNGDTQVRISTPKTNYPIGNDNIDASIKDNYQAAQTYVNVTVIDGSTITPPKISPASTTYYKSFKATLTADEKYPAYYLVEDNGGISTVDEGTPVSKPTWEKIKNNKNKVKVEKGQKALIDIPDGDGHIVNIYAVSYDEDNSTATSDIAGHVISRTYTYSHVDAPVLTPGKEGYNNYYPFSNKLSVDMGVNTDEAQIYYTINSTSDNVNRESEGVKVYDGEPLVLDKSSYIRAVAYKDGAYSEVVRYRFAKMSDDIEAPTFHINSSDALTEYTFKDDEDTSDRPITIKARYVDDNGDVQTIDEKSTTHSIYYTLDGSTPTDNSYLYEGPFTVHGGVNTVTAAVYANKGSNADNSISDYSTLTLRSTNYNLWKTDEDNCPGGVLNNTHQELKGDITIGGETIKDKTLLNIDFGGINSSKDNWDRYTAKEPAKGSPVDGIGLYSIAPDTDAKDEEGVLYNHKKAAQEQTHISTFGLPAKGAYTKLEPQFSGKLTIWCYQEGALYYSNRIEGLAGNEECFNNQFLRKRPVYFIDEAGVSLKPIDVFASGTLSNNWNRLDSNNFLDKGGNQNGIDQTLFTKEQTQNIYHMFYNVISSKVSNGISQKPTGPSLNEYITYLHDGSNDLKKQVAGYQVGSSDEADDVTDGTGVCLPSGSYIRYTFNVQAGKTYYFFGWMTKVGIRGIGFEPAKEEGTGTPSLDIYTSNAQSADNNSEKNVFSDKLNKTYNVTVKRTFKQKTWTTLVLPFSISESQMKQVFGDETEVLHYRTIEGTTMYFFKHYHQMLVAGTPVLIYPQGKRAGVEDESDIVNPTFNQVTIEKAEATDKPCNDYGYEGTTNQDFQMVGSFTPQKVTDGNYYVSNTGSVKRLMNSKDGYIMLSGTRAYIIGTKADGTLTSLDSYAKTAFDNPVATPLNGGTTGIDLIGIDNGTEQASQASSAVYNLNGQLVNKSGSLKNLPKGIYIINGKKIIKE